MSTKGTASRDDTRVRPHVGLHGALILIVEDERILAQTMELYLRNDGYRTERAHDGEEGLRLWRAAAPDLVVLDLGLPKIDGVEVLKTIRQDSQVPIVILTARDEEIDELLGLGLGADDYLVKPVSGRKLIAHVQAVLRRSRLERDLASDVIRLGLLTVDAYRVEALYDGVALDLTPTEFRLLRHLAVTPGRAVSRDELYDVALPEGDALERAVDIHVTNLRRKLREAGSGEVIETVRGVGYRLARTTE